MMHDFDTRPHPEPVEGRGRSRRAVMLGAGVSTFVGGAARAGANWPARLARLERSMGGRLGVAAFEVGGPQLFSHRATERFPMCSTFKLSLAAAVLEAADKGRMSLDATIHYGASDLLEYAPVTRAHLGEGGLSLRELCRAAVEVSDNTAANLLLKEIGGPAALTARWRAWGDRETRLDRIEPALNSSIPGDPRDTTTPAAMAGTLRTLLFGSALHPSSRVLLRSWMQNCQTGLTKLRAGLPSTVTVGDKTGNNGRDTMGDIAFIEAPGQRTCVIACYLTGARVDAKAQDAVFREVGRLVSEAHGMRTAHG